MVGIKRVPPIAEVLLVLHKWQEAVETLILLPYSLPNTNFRDILLMGHHSSMLPF